LALQAKTASIKSLSDFAFLCRYPFQWLYQTTRNASIDVVRSEVRRTAREQNAIQMSAPNETSAGWTDNAPRLDEATRSLEQTDPEHFCHSVALKTV
jgi:predicted RNA polymerase sigma factor